MMWQLWVLAALAALAVVEAAEEGKGALVSIKKAKREIHFAIDGGEDHAFVPCKKRHLGGKNGEADVDTFRGQCHDGQDVVLIRLTDGKDGKRQFDGPGLASIDGAQYKLVQDGDITETKGKITFRVKLEEPDTNNKKKDKGAEDDEVKPPKEAEDEAQETEKRGRRDLLRRKRANYNELWLELAIYVDKGFWDNYSKKYGSQAEAKINSFVEGIIDVMESDYNGLKPRVNVNANIFQIWKTQPSFSSAGKMGGSINQYLGDLAKSDYNAAKKKVDHSLILSGFELVNRNTLGLAYVRTMCHSPSYAASVMNTFDMTAGETVVHEVGHSFGVWHDSSDQGQYEKNCPGSGYVMAAYASLGSSKDLKWSSCSLQRLKYEIGVWDQKNINCLTNKPSGAGNGGNNGNNGGNNGNNGGNNGNNGGGNSNCKNEYGDWCVKYEVHEGGKYGYLCTDYPTWAARCKKSCKQC